MGPGSCKYHAYACGMQALGCSMQRDRALQRCWPLPHPLQLLHCVDQFLLVQLILCFEWHLGHSPRHVCITAEVLHPPNLAPSPALHSPCLVSTRTQNTQFQNTQVHSSPPSQHPDAGILSILMRWPPFDQKHDAPKPVHGIRKPYARACSASVVLIMAARPKASAPRRKCVQNPACMH